MAFAALKERVMRLNAEIAGHRFLFGTVAVGRSDLEIARAAGERARGVLGDVWVDAAKAWRELEFATSFQARLDGVGRLSAEDARRFGAVGPAARAAGVAGDRREASVGLCYEGFEAASLDDPEGDVSARLRIRAAELERSFELLDELLAEPVEAGEASISREADPIGIGRVESPRGETVCVVDASAGRVRRLHLRTASYANWPALAHACTGELLAGLPADQQELRALLRVCRSLMFVLLRQLDRVRRRAALPPRRDVRSLALRHVDAGSCNGCEHELTAASGPDYDLQRFGLDVVASPRHADALLVTGAVTKRMETALRRAYEAMPEPRLVVALGDCALGRGVLATGDELAAPLDELLPVDIRVPGCPPTPDAIASVILAGLA